jgi:hypothetical protein
MIQQNQSVTQNPTITLALDGEANSLKKHQGKLDSSLVDTFTAS